MDKTELELRKQLERNEKEKKRSRKWFFVNLFAATFFILFTLWLFPLLLQFIVKQLKWLEKSGKATTVDTLWVNEVRLDYLKWSVFFLWVADASLWLFWVAFRFRKWTDYGHQVNVLKEELEKLEKER